MISPTVTTRHSESWFRFRTFATSDYNIDYAILASSRIGRCCDIRLGMAGAGLRFEAVKGECNMGQQEIGFRYDEALVTCDNHAFPRTAPKKSPTSFVRANVHGEYDEHW